MTKPVPPDKLRLGGMALRNGLLVHGPTHWAAAVRAPDGEVKVASGPKPSLGSKRTEVLPLIVRSRPVSCLTHCAMGPCRKPAGRLKNAAPTAKAISTTTPSRTFFMTASPTH